METKFKKSFTMFIDKNQFAEIKRRAAEHEVSVAEELRRLLEAALAIKTNPKQKGGDNE